MSVKQEGRARRTRFGSVALGLVVTAVFLLLAIRGVEWGEVARVFRRAEFFPWIPIAIAVYIVGLFVRGARTRILLTRGRPITLLTATNAVVLGSGVNNMLPARLGELARAGLLSKRSGLPFLQALTIVFLERVLDGLMIMLAFIVAAWLLPVPEWMTDVAIFAGAVFLVALVGIGAALLFPLLLPILVTRYFRWLPAKLNDLMLRLAFDVTRTITPLRDPVLALGGSLLSALAWICEAIAYLLLLPSFGIASSVSAGLLTMSLTNLGILLPSSPGFVGPFDYFCMQAVVFLGTAEAIALSYAISMHLLIYATNTLWAVAILSVLGVKLTQTIALTKVAQPKAHELAGAGLMVNIVGQYVSALKVERPSRYLSAIVEAISPWDKLSLSEADQCKVLSEATEFVQSQIYAMSTGMRLQVWGALMGFRAYSWIRCGGDFCRLPLARRRQLADSWSYGPLYLPRQFFRMLRSITLLAYFEHPVVARAHHAASTDEKGGGPLENAAVASQPSGPVRP